jgi:hypothetical protein
MEGATIKNALTMNRMMRNTEIGTTRAETRRVVTMEFTAAP